MYTVVTGAAGFIGSNLVKALNARGETRIIAVDNLAAGAKARNLFDCVIADYLDKREFLELLNAANFDDEISAVLHQGACSDTTQSDGRYMLQNNHRYSVALLKYCQEHDVPLIYASSAAVYGAIKPCIETAANERPLNVYGYSKLVFDQYLRQRARELHAPVVGLRYFNVYGPREAHKGAMASVVYHFHQQYLAQHRVRLFEGTDGYAAGEQRRDFVSVDDIVKLNLHFLDHPIRFGILNVGTGVSRSFNDMAAATINAVRAGDGEAPLSAARLRELGAIEYIPFPDTLKGKYQSHTEADLSALRAAGYQAPFIALEQGVANYVAQLQGAPL